MIKVPQTIQTSVLKRIMSDADFAKLMHDYMNARLTRSFINFDEASKTAVRDYLAGNLDATGFLKAVGLTETKNNETYNRMRADSYAMRIVRQFGMSLQG